MHFVLCKNKRQSFRPNFFHLMLCFEAQLMSGKRSQKIELVVRYQFYRYPFSYRFTIALVVKQHIERNSVVVHLLFRLESCKGNQTWEAFLKLVRPLQNLPRVNPITNYYSSACSLLWRLYQNICCSFGVGYVVCKCTRYLQPFFTENAGPSNNILCEPFRVSFGKFQRKPGSEKSAK